MLLLLKGPIYHQILISKGFALVNATFWSPSQWYPQNVERLDRQVYTFFPRKPTLIDKIESKMEGIQLSIAFISSRGQ